MIKYKVVLTTEISPMIKSGWSNSEDDTEIYKTWERELDHKQLAYLLGHYMLKFGEPAVYEKTPTATFVDFTKLNDSENPTSTVSVFLEIFPLNEQSLEENSLSSPLIDNLKEKKLVK